jgi:predicted NBD/HSP70 family sugar kinase
MRCGFDIGGTKTEFCVLDGDEIIFRERLKNIDDNLLNIYKLVEKSGIKKINKIGFSLKAIIDPIDNKIIQSSLKFLNNDFIKTIQNKYDCEIKLQNDAKCFAWAEANLGAGKNFNTGFYLILGTGVGGATIFNKQILSGFGNFAGEVGKILYQNGCFEDILSGVAFSKNFYNYSPQEIMQKYRNNDKNAIKYFNIYMQNLASLISIIINIVSPEVIVIGGGLSNIEEIIDLLPRYLKENIYIPVIRKNELGDSSGVIGACLL